MSNRFLRKYVTSKNVFNVYTTMALCALIVCDILTGDKVYTVVLFVDRTCCVSLNMEKVVDMMQYDVTHYVSSSSSSRGVRSY